MDSVLETETMFSIGARGRVSTCLVAGKGQTIRMNGFSMCGSSRSFYPLPTPYQQQTIIEIEKHKDAVHTTIEIRLVKPY